MRRVRFGNSAAALEGFIDPAAKNKRGQKSFKSKVFAITLFSGKREGRKSAGVLTSLQKPETLENRRCCLMDREGRRPPPIRVLGLRPPPAGLQGRTALRPRPGFCNGDCRGLPLPLRSVDGLRLCVRLHVSDPLSLSNLLPSALSLDVHA